MATSTAQSEKPAPWYSAYPEPKATDLPSFSKEDVLELLETTKATGAKDYILIDVRRTDFEGGSIRGSINLPAQSLYTTIPTLYTLFKAAGLKKVIWYCNACHGRGPRSAGWFADYLEQVGEQEISSYILEGGIKGFALAGSEYVEWLNEYNEEVWKKLDSTH